MYISVGLALVVLFIFIVCVTLWIWSKLVLRNKLKKLFYKTMITLDATFIFFDKTAHLWYDKDGEIFRFEIPDCVTDNNEQK